MSNYDPFSKAFVGSEVDRLKVASPIYKHNFDLRTGECLDDPAVTIPTFEVRVTDGRVQVALP
ncbi:MAG: nitrite reductase (NAD(P)H) small subunit [Egibacteraceae bacterium]